MRLEGRMRLGYYPLHQREAQRMRRFLQFPDELTSALDPCAGTGAALVAITENSCSRRYGIELDSHRALEARTTLNELIQGNAFDAFASRVVVDLSRSLVGNAQPGSVGCSGGCGLAAGTSEDF